MDILFLGLTIGIIGKVLLGVSVINVHGHIMKEHHIDNDVLQAMETEKWIAIAGVVFMIVGYILELLFYGYPPF